MSSQRLPSMANNGKGVNGSYGPPMATNGVRSSLMCSMPSLPMNAPMNGCNQWPSVWTAPPNSYQYNYQFNPTQAMQWMANPLQAWASIPGLMGTHIAPQFMMNGRNQTNVPSIQRFPNSCDNQSIQCPQSEASTKSFDVHNSHSKNNHFNASQSHSINFKSNQRNDRNTNNHNNNNNNNHYKRDISHKTNRLNHSHSSTQSKLNYKPSKRSSDSRGYYQDNAINKGRDNYEPESKRKRFISSKGSDSKPNSENSDKYNDLSTKTSAKREQSSTVDTEQILTKPVEWLRCSPADLFYQTQRDNPESVVATRRLLDLRDKFRYELLDRSRRAIESKPKFVFPPRVVRLKPPKTSN